MGLSHCIDAMVAHLIPDQKVVCSNYDWVINLPLPFFQRKNYLGCILFCIIMDLSHYSSPPQQDYRPLLNTHVSAQLYYTTGLRGATVARLTPDQKVACSNHVGVSCVFSTHFHNFI